MTDLTIEDALWNAILFTDRKSHIGDQMRIRCGTSTGCWITGADDHVIVRTRTKEVIAGDWLYPTIKEAKAYITDAEPVGEHSASAMWQDVDLLLGLRPSDMSVDDLAVFALRPERFAKFGRLRTGGDYPIDFALGYANTLKRHYLLFRAGPNVRGVVAPVLRGRLAEEFKAEKGVLWDE